MVERVPLDNASQTVEQARAPLWRVECQTKLVRSAFGGMARAARERRAVRNIDPSPYARQPPRGRRLSMMEVANRRSPRAQRLRRRRLDKRGSPSRRSSRNIGVRGGSSAGSRNLRRRCTAGSAGRRRCAALVGAGRLLVVVEADDRARDSSASRVLPAFEIAQEVVRAAVGAEVVRHARRSCGNAMSLAGHDRGAIGRRHRPARRSRRAGLRTSVSSFQSSTAASPHRRSPRTRRGRCRIVAARPTRASIAL